MKTLVIRIEIEIPDGVAVTVGSGAASGAAPALPTPPPSAWSEGHTTPIDEPPWPDLTSDAGAVFGDLVRNPENVLHDTPHVVAGPVAPPGGHHGQPWKFVPAGVSKRTGKPYTGFFTCAEKDCNEKPR